MKATIKFDDGREATIELTPEQVNEINERQGFELGQYYYHCGYTPTHNLLDRQIDISIQQLHTLKEQGHCELLQSRFELELEMFRWASEMNEGWDTNFKLETYWVLIKRADNTIAYLPSNDATAGIFGLAFKSKEIAEQAKGIFWDRILSIYGKQF